MLCVLRNTLWMLGGQVEISHTDIVLGERSSGEHTHEAAETGPVRSSRSQGSSTSQVANQ